MSNSTRVRVINQFGTATSITGTATRSPVVRFAPRQDEPMAPLMEVQEQHHPYQPGHLPHPSMQQSSCQQHHYHQQLRVQPQFFPDQIVVDYPPRRMFGFNPALLNPILSLPNFQGQSFSSQPNTGLFNFSTAPDPLDPFHYPPSHIRSTTLNMFFIIILHHLHDVAAGEDPHASSARSFPVAQRNPPRANATTAA